MARNPIQFQKGMSLSVFQERFGREEQCEAALVAWRWPDGFICPHCGCRDHAIVGKRRLYSCRGCRRQTSIKAGTIFAHTHVPLTKWFQAMWLITQSKNSISTLELSRQIGVKWDSAWLMRQKLGSVIVEHQAGEKLDGRIEMDEAVLGGEQTLKEGGKRGQSGPNKLPFVIAVATRDDGRPQRLLLHVVTVLNKDNIEAMAKSHLAPTAHVISDGYWCFRSVTKAGCEHQRIITKHRGLQSHKMAEFRWVNTVLGNIKTAITATHRSLRKHYTFRYLAEFQFRFNRRYRLARMLDELGALAAQTTPRPYRLITVA